MAKGIYEKWLEPENLTLLRGWRRDGLTIEQIAKNIGIRRQTLEKWRVQHKDIGDALKKGDVICVYDVENALYKAAIGYDVTETDQTETTHPNGKVTVVKHAKRRHIPPNVGAVCFILKNRRGDMWKDSPVFVDTQAIMKLEEIHKAIVENAADDDLHYMTEDEVQQETEGIHTEGK